MLLAYLIGFYDRLLWQTGLSDYPFVCCMVYCIETAAHRPFKLISLPSRPIVLVFSVIENWRRLDNFQTEIPILRISL